MVYFEKFMKTLHCEDNAQFFRDVEGLRGMNEAMVGWSWGVRLRGTSCKACILGCFVV